MAKASKVSEEPKSNLPVHTLRHRSLEAAIWRNSTSKGRMYNVTVVRSFKDGEGWRESHSFGYDDLMNVAKLLYDAHSWITAARAQEAAERKAAPRAAEK
jgi:hypothetical protein